MAATGHGAWGHEVPRMGACREVGAAPPPCCFLGPLATREREVGLSFFFRGSLVNLEKRSLSLSSSPFSSFFFLSFFTPVHFRRCPPSRAPQVHPEAGEDQHVPPFPWELGGSTLTLCQGTGLLCSARLVQLLHPRAPGLGLGLQRRILPLLFHLLPLQNGAAETTPPLSPFSLCKATAAYTVPALFPRYGQALHQPHVEAGTRSRDGDTFLP